MKLPRQRVASAHDEGLPNMKRKELAQKIDVFGHGILQSSSAERLLLEEIPARRSVFSRSVRPADQDLLHPVVKGALTQSKRGRERGGFVVAATKSV